MEVAMSTSMALGISSSLGWCYGRLAVVSDVDGGGFALNVDNENEGLPCYNKASTTEQCWDQGGQDAHKVDECTE
jgi:hypothetical protein